MGWTALTDGAHMHLGTMHHAVFELIHQSVGSTTHTQSSAVGWAPQDATPPDSTDESDVRVCRVVGSVPG